MNIVNIVNIVSIERPAPWEFPSKSIVALQQLDLAVPGLRHCA